MPRPFALLLLVAGTPAIARQEPAEKAADPAPAADGFRADPGWKRLGPAVWFDAKERRLIVRARVALREGALEHLLCRENTKEHESVLATDAPPRLIHAGLNLTGAKEGHPVRHRPKFEAPAGTPIIIEVEWREGGQARRADAREWVRDDKTGKGLDQTWVFGGSELFQDPETKRMIYAADSGDLITVANFPSAILDVPFASTNVDDDRLYVANTAQIPPRGTPVTMYLRPAPAAAPKP